MNGPTLGFYCKYLRLILYTLNIKLDLLLQILMVCALKMTPWLRWVSCWLLLAATNQKRPSRKRLILRMLLYNVKWNLLVLLAFQRWNNLNSHSACKMFTVEKKEKKKSMFSTALEAPCFEVKGDAFPPSSDSQSHDGNMLEFSWERLHVWMKAVQTHAQVRDSVISVRVFAHEQNIGCRMNLFCTCAV